ncbi:hypothetical protein E2C01_008141 [Portunus trituberculatus]|uniref:Uncharacterized protein n=1 Tax=Portunus trituberculatus TaxID=210409 RepID=A0A5B7D351_PORTR|nr:hypothetical protein [Portunus trituberculatus]
MPRTLAKVSELFNVGPKFIVREEETLCHHLTSLKDAGSTRATLWSPQRGASAWCVGSTRATLVTTAWSFAVARFLRHALSPLRP